MIDTNRKSAECYEQGFCVLPAVYNADECRRMRELMGDHWRRKGSPPLDEGTFGIGIHPMMPHVPDIAPFMDREEIIGVLSKVMRDDVRLMHLGARISGDNTGRRIEWHNHYAWDSSNITKRDRIERMLFGVYVDGSTADSGPLIVLPRRYNDPIGEMLGGIHEPWPGEVEVDAPPGSVVIFDTALWHTARNTTKRIIRHLWGAHVQGWHNPTPHPEDNPCDVPEIAKYKQEYSGLRSLLDPPRKAKTEMAEPFRQ